MRTIKYSYYKKLGISTRGEYDKVNKTINVNGCDRLIDCVGELSKIMTDELASAIGCDIVDGKYDYDIAALNWFRTAELGCLDLNADAFSLPREYAELTSILKKYF